MLHLVPYEGYFNRNNDIFTVDLKGKGYKVGDWLLLYMVDEVAIYNTLLVEVLDVEQASMIRTYLNFVVKLIREINLPEPLLPYQLKKKLQLVYFLT